MPAPVVLPSSFRRRAASAIGPLLGVPVMVAVGFALDPSDPNWAWPAMLLLVGVATVVRAWLIRRRPALIFDEEGIRSGKTQKLLLSWPEAALIWIGQAAVPGLSRFSPVSLHAFTAASLHYARRTGFTPDPRLVVGVETTLPLNAIPALVRQFTSAEVQTGNAKELRRLIDGLRAGPRDVS